VIVDLLVQLVTGLEELHNFKVVLVRIHNLIINDSAIVQKDFVVVLSKTQTHHFGVTLNIVKLVHVNRVALVVDNIKHP